MPRRLFILRMLRHLAGAVGLVVGALAIGIFGYHYIAGFSWVDSLLNAAMILGGMGPVNPLTDTASKLFASFYALFAGIIFLVIAGVLFAPIFHRFLHRFHLSLDDE
jgi:flagellar biosynthesis protein FliR